MVGNRALAQEPESARGLLRPTLAAGGSILEYDVGGEKAWRGYLLRGGVQVGDFGSVTLAAQFWPELAYDTDGRSTLLEASYFPLGRQTVAPYLAFGAGRFSASLPGAPDGSTSGTATMLAIGIQVWPLSSWGLDVAGVVRYDAGNDDDELRVSLMYSPLADRWRRGAAMENPVRIGVAWLVPLGGPWRFVEPAYLVSVDRRVSGHHAVSVATGLVHWQIPLRGTAGYAWDTRAALVLPTWSWFTELLRPTRAHLEAGPLLSAMVEGPDAGVRGGLHAGVGGAVALPEVGLSAGVSLLWLSRADTDGDQTGLLLQLAVTF